MHEIPSQTQKQKQKLEKKILAKTTVFKHHFCTKHCHLLEIIGHNVN